MKAGKKHPNQKSGRRHHGRTDQMDDGIRKYKRHGRGGRRGRARRGEARYVLLDVLRDAPKHGYEVIKRLETRSGGQYIPSPGTVYPTLQYLEDQGLVQSHQEAERRVYQLTDAGKTELESRAVAIEAFWSRFAAKNETPAGQPEIGFLEDELEHLNQVVWRGLREAIAQDNQTMIRQVRQVVETCQNQVREVITSKIQ